MGNGQNGLHGGGERERGRKGTGKTVSLTLSRRRENREKVENGFSPASPNPKCSHACQKQQLLAPSTKYVILLTRTEVSPRPLSLSLSPSLSLSKTEPQRDREASALQWLWRTCPSLPLHAKTRLPLVPKRYPFTMHL